MITIRVYGRPAPQGSKRHVGGGVMIESSKFVKPWRESVRWAFIEAGKPHVAGPVFAEMIFTMPKPKSAPKSRKTWPAVAPDVSKLARATEDAITDMGGWEDDSRLVEYKRLAKVYPGEDCDALDSPGVVIRLYPAIEAKA